MCNKAGGGGGALKVVLLFPVQQPEGAQQFNPNPSNELLLSGR